MVVLSPGQGLMKREVRKVIGRKLCCLVGLLLCTLELFGFSAQNPDRTTNTLIITGGSLIDGIHSYPIADVTIVIEGNLIKEVLTKTPTPLPSGEVVDATGKSILPGLIDSHVHYRDYQPPLYLAFGITTVFDLGNPVKWIQAQARANREGLIQGPRIFYVGNMLNAPRRAGDHYSPGEKEEGYYTVVNNATDLSQAVLEQQRLGANAIKMHRRHTAELMRSVAAEAHKLGLPFLSHVDSVDPRVAISVGLDCIVHTGGIEKAVVRNPRHLNQLQSRNSRVPQALWESEHYPELIRLMVESDVYLNPTVANNWGMVASQQPKHQKFEREFLQKARMSFIPEEYRDRFLTYIAAYSFDDTMRSEMRKGYMNVRSFVKQFVEGGGKVVAGSDSGTRVLPGSGLHRELELLVDAGLTTFQAIQAATIHSASLFRLADKLGTIEPGKFADIILVDGNPLESITDIANITTVIKNGRVVEVEFRSDYVNPVPRNDFLPVGR